MEAQSAPEPTPAVVQARVKYLQCEIISMQQAIKELISDRQAITIKLKWMDQKQQEQNFFLFQMSKELYDLENPPKPDEAAAETEKVNV